MPAHDQNGPANAFEEELRRKAAEEEREEVDLDWEKMKEEAYKAVKNNPPPESS